MLQFLTIQNGKYVLYDTTNNSFDYYSVVQLKRLLATRSIQGVTLNNGIVEVQFTHNGKYLTRDLGAIKYVDGHVDGLESPTFIIRKPMQIPKLPMDTTIYYKGIYVYVGCSSAYLPERNGKANNQKGKLLSISSIQECPDAKNDLMEYPANYSLDEYSQLVQDFLSCLVYDATILTYNVYIYAKEPFLDLTKFPKSVKIKRYNTFINYYLYLITENIQRIKYSGMYLRLSSRFIDITNHISRPITLLDCTDFKIADWHKAGLREGFEEIVYTKLHNYGVIVFRRSSTLIQAIKQSLLQREDVNVINIGNFKNHGDLESTLQDIRKKQGKYALTHTNGKTLIILLANIT